MPDTEVRHGSLVGYRHHKCRCGLCCEANTKAVRDWRRRAGTIPRPVPIYMPDEDALIDGQVAP